VDCRQAVRLASRVQASKQKGKCAPGPGKEREEKAVNLEEGEGANKLQHYIRGVCGGTLDAASLGTRATYLTVVRERSMPQRSSHGQHSCNKPCRQLALSLASTAGTCRSRRQCDGPPYGGTSSGWQRHHSSRELASCATTLLWCGQAAWRTAGMAGQPILRQYASGTAALRSQSCAQASIGAQRRGRGCWGPHVGPWESAFAHTAYMLGRGN